MKGSDAMCTQQALNKIAQELKSEALLLFPNIHKIILYGSYARGDNTPESDIDIMIIIDDAEENIKKYRNQFSKTAALLGMKYDVLLSVLFRDKGNFYKRAQYMPFYKNIVNEGVEWWFHPCSPHSGELFYLPTLQRERVSLKLREVATEKNFCPLQN